MKSIVVYYSFSGGTHKIAHAVHKGMSRVAEQSDIVAIKGDSGIPGMKPADLLGYDLIAFGNPVWEYMPTPNMMSFIKNLPDLRGKHVVAFLTHGTMPTRAMRWMVRTLKSKHATVIGWNDWYGSCYPWDIFKPYYTDGHPDNIDLKEAEDFGKEMVMRSRRISKGEAGLIPTLATGKEYIKLYGSVPSPSKVPNWTERKHMDVNIDMKKCTRCELCVDNCPTGSIDLSKKTPINDKNCMNCMVCEQICPTGAVEIDYDGFTKGQERWGKNWERMSYFHKASMRVAADPRFRRLVPLEDVGKSGAWFQISKHPRIKLP